MGNISTNISEVSTRLTNDYLNSLNENCSADCTGTVSGNTVFIGRNSEVGSVDFTSTCSSSATCAMANVSQTTIQNILKNISSQSTEAVTDFMGDLSFTGALNANIASSAVTNHITQITNQACQGVSDLTVTNNFTYLSSDSKVKKGINYAAKGSSDAGCAISNLSKMQAYNDIQANSDQETKSIGMFAIFGIAIIVIVIGAILIFVLLIATGAFAGILKGGKDKDGNSKSIINSENANALIKVLETTA